MQAVKKGLMDGVEMFDMENGDDTAMLQDLARYLHDAGESANITQRLSELLKRPGPSGSVLIRAKVYNSMIAVALGYTEDNPDWFEWLESLLGSIRNGELEQWAHPVVRYLLKKLEEEDDFMSVIFYSALFNKRPVPLFHSCTKDVFVQISSLWLSGNLLFEVYFTPLIKPILSHVKPATSKTDRNFIEAKQMLCNHLFERGVKAGARLIWLTVLVWKTSDTYHTSHVVGELLQRAIFQHDNFDACFSMDFPDDPVELYNAVTDIVPSSQGLDCAFGLHNSIIDQSLLCWAARRNYCDLIWVILHGFELKKSESWRKYDYTGSGRVMVNQAWKMAFWCGTRHGHRRVIDELSACNWEGIGLNEYPWRCTPPLHLVAILGDTEMLQHFCNHAQLRVNFNADINDQRGKTPLDYAMQYLVKFNQIEEKLHPKDFLVWSIDKKLNEYTSRRTVVQLLLLLPGVRQRLDELYTMYINQANTVLISAAVIASVAFSGWLQPPPFTEIMYASNERNLMKSFIVFNTLSFFLAIATMFAGAEATLFVHDKDSKVNALIEMRKSIKWMIGFFISSMLCIMGAFICAGLLILPPIRQLNSTMVIPLALGGGICLIPLSFIFWSFVRRWKDYYLSKSKQSYYIQVQREGELWEKNHHYNPNSLIEQEDLDAIKRELEAAPSMPRKRPPICSGRGPR